MATWTDVCGIAGALPRAVHAGSVEGRRGWSVGAKGFVWERPLSRADTAALGADAPTGPVVAVQVPDLDGRPELLAASPRVLFVSPHFAGYPAVLIRLDEIDIDELAELVTDAWLARAPKKLVAEYLSQHDPGVHG